MATSDLRSSASRACSKDAVLCSCRVRQSWRKSPETLMIHKLKGIFGFIRVNPMYLTLVVRLRDDPHIPAL